VRCLGLQSIQNAEHTSSGLSRSSSRTHHAGSYDTSLAASPSVGNFQDGVLVWKCLHDEALRYAVVVSHMCLSAFTLGHMCADKSLNASSDLRPTV